MAEEEITGSASPAPSDHKRKFEDLDSEPFEQPPVSGEYNGNSQSEAHGHGDAATSGGSTEDPDAKRSRIDDIGDVVVEATNNGHQEEKDEELKEDVTEPLDVNKNIIESKVNEPLDIVQKTIVTDESVADELANKESVADELVNKESVADELVNKESENNETYEKTVDLESSENVQESVKVENQVSGVEQQDPTTYVASEDDVFGFKEQSQVDDQPTSRRMEIPSNKVGVLIGKSGDTIRTLQFNSGARIQITRDSEADPTATTRPVQILGSIESINKAEKLIKEVIAEADAGGSPFLVARGFSANSSGFGEQFHLQVPNEKVGVIIGKGGETIKNLQTRSGARIQLIPQHLPDGDQSKERTVRITGDRRQIEMARDMIKEVMGQPIRSSNPTGGYNQQNFRPHGSGGSQWGPRGGHSSHSSGYNNYPPRGGYSSQNPPYSSQGYGNYPPQQLPPRNNYGWDQRPPPVNKQGPPDQTGYDYYGGHMGPPSQPPPPMNAPAPAMGPPPYNYGPPQGPDYGPQSGLYQPQGYGEPRYDHHQGPGQHSYGGQGTQPPSYPTNTHPGYGQPDQYVNKPPPAYNMPPQQGPYGQPYGQPPRQQPYPASSGSGYPQYNDGSGGYGPQGGQPVSGYGQYGGQQPAASGYGQAVPVASGGYGHYPSTQPGYNEQAAPNSAGYGYQGMTDPAYGGGGSGYGAPPVVQPVYSQTAPAPAPAVAPAAVQPGYDQSAPQTVGFVAPQAPPQPQPQPQPQAGYGQYDGSQMYAGHR